MSLLLKDNAAAIEVGRMTRSTTHDLSSGTYFYKLGQDGSYKSYINQFSAHPTSQSRQQANEERIKKQHMSHKFSLTDVCAFKWVSWQV